LRRQQLNIARLASPQPAAGTTVKLPRWHKRRFENKTSRMLRKQLHCLLEPLGPNCDTLNVTLGVTELYRAFRNVLRDCKPNKKTKGPTLTELFTACNGIALPSHENRHQQFVNATLPSLSSQSARIRRCTQSTWQHACYTMTIAVNSSTSVVSFQVMLWKVKHSHYRP
jgi:hypothetical protein